MTSKTATLERKQQFLETYLQTRYQHQVEREIFDNWDDDQAEIHLEHPNSATQDQIETAVKLAVNELTNKGFTVAVKEKKHRTILKVT